MGRSIRKKGLYFKGNVSSCSQAAIKSFLHLLTGPKSCLYKTGRQEEARGTFLNWATRRDSKERQRKAFLLGASAETHWQQAIIPVRLRPSGIRWTEGGGGAFLWAFVRSYRPCVSYALCCPSQVRHLQQAEVCAQCQEEKKEEEARTRSAFIPPSLPLCT